MKKASWIGWVMAVMACGDANVDAMSGSDAATSSESSGSTKGPGSDGSETASASATNSAPDTSADTTDSTKGEGTSGGSTDATHKFDLGAANDLPLDDCGAVIGAPEFSYLWVANSVEGTISKIDTETAVELARYYVRPDGEGDPSRTSVNLAGDVVVASRAGGLTKVFARVDDCVDSNGIPGIQSSQGSTPLPWDEEECVAWFTPMDYSTQRPVAWTAGTLNEETCVYEHPKVWTVGAQVGKTGTMQASRLNGDDGTIDAQVSLEMLAVGSFGAYGGAVDGHDDFWFIVRDHEPYPLVRITGDTLTVSVWSVPAPLVPYGLAIDANGRPWIASYAHGIARFDPGQEAWSVAAGPVGTGIQIDASSRAWIAYSSAGPPGVFALDVETMAVVDTVMLPTQVKGVSIDFAGYVWAVGTIDSAYRVDPETHEIVTITGLNAPYTYSDMTGWGLTSVQPPS